MVLTLRSPLVIASGPGGMGEYLPFITPHHLGAYILKTITYHPKEGSAPPRLSSTKHFVINRIGLENPGIKAFIEDIKSGALSDIMAQVPLILSLGGDTPQEYVEIARLSQDIAHHFIAIEYNFSCPNVEAGGLSIVSDKHTLRQIMTEVRDILHSSFIIAKFGIEGIFVEEASDIVKDTGWNGITLINTIRGLVKTPQGYLRGGISGAVLKHIGMRAVYEVKRRHEDMFIMASGGVYTAQDVKDYLEVGASAVQIGSALFKDPSIVDTIYRQLDIPSDNIADNVSE